MSESDNLLKLIGPSNVAALLWMKAPLHHANRQVRPVLDDKVASDQPLGGRLREGYAHPGLRRPVHAIHAQLSVHQLAGGHLRQAVQARPVLVHGDGHPVDEEVHLHVDDHIGRQFDHLAEVDIAQRHAVGAVHAQQADAVVHEEQHLLVARPGQRQHVLDGLLRLEQTEADHSLPGLAEATHAGEAQRHLRRMVVEGVQIGPREKSGVNAKLKVLLQPALHRLWNCREKSSSRNWRKKKVRK